MVESINLDEGAVEGLGRFAGAAGGEEAAEMIGNVGLEGAERVGSEILSEGVAEAAPRLSAALVDVSNPDPDPPLLPANQPQPQPQPHSQPQPQPQPQSHPQPQVELDSLYQAFATLTISRSLPLTVRCPYLSANPERDLSVNRCNARDHVV